MNRLIGIAAALAALAGPAMAQQFSVRFGPEPVRARHYAACPTPAVVYVPVPVAPRGYWTTHPRTVRTPGEWTWSQHLNGTYHKRWTPGRYQTIAQPVWVDHPARGHARAWR